MNVLILGASGMLGNAMYRVFSASGRDNVTGTIRNPGARRHFDPALHAGLVSDVEVENLDVLTRLFGQHQPDLVINCIGLVKQLAAADDPLQTIPLNSLLPHRLAALCEVAGARLVQISTDCVFAGTRGNYLESDLPDATDLYGRTKLLGEVDYPHAVTLRTSIIGHELEGNRSLVNWFLSQQGSVKGFTRAIFSGLPTVVLAGIVRDVVVAHPALRGLYHVAAAPISKYDLVRKIAEVYGKEIEIVPDAQLVLDRSLNGQRFTEATGYMAPDWDHLIRAMRDFG